MDKSYIDTVRLLLRVAPDVFEGDLFAMKGGTAINLFVRDMPRLSPLPIAIGQLIQKMNDRRRLIRERPDGILVPSPRQYS